MSTANVLPKSSSSKPKKRCTKRRWPVEDTGRNSVSPSTTPRTKALKRSNSMTAPRIEGDGHAQQRAGRSGRCGFPASLTSGQRERANIAQVARVPLYPKDRGRPNVTGQARAPTLPQSLRPHADVVSSPVLSAFPLRALGARRIRHRGADRRGARLGAPRGVLNSQPCLHDAGGGGGGSSASSRGVHHRRIFGRDEGSRPWRAAAAAARTGCAGRSSPPHELVQRQIFCRGKRAAYHGTPI